MLNYLYTHQLLYYFVVLLCAASIALIAIPSILHVARKRHLYDDLGHFRKQHDQGIPRLGGVAMFVSFTITVLMLGIADKVLPINCLISACIVLLAMGLKDDLYGVNPSTKFVVQFVVAVIVAICGDIRIGSLHGILGITHLPYAVSLVLTMFCIILVVNAFNLIDGIDGLAATLGIMCNCTFAALFIYLGQYQLAAIALAIVGAIFGFLKFNITPAKLFMGDTGSLLIGFISVIMGIEMLNVGSMANAEAVHWFSVPALVAAAFITPLFDTTRVFIYRLAAGNSPFTADRNHIHHRLLKLGLTHLQATLLLVSINVFAIVLVLATGVHNALLEVSGIAVGYMLLNWLLTFALRSKKRENLALRNLFA
jgi:UDP-GlcNAc:undecaprenyl-phosphate GlcNAc-1-phosphate transferase